MTSMLRKQLEEAYRLIQQEKLDDAQKLLREFLARNPDNVDGWWLMANAVTQPEDAYHALGNVLRIKPDHADAREAFNQLVADYPNLEQSAAMPPPASTEDFSADISVDIDDLLIKTGSLRNDPLKPDPDKDVSNAYLDDLWAGRQETVGESATGADLDQFFGGKGSVDVPAISNEDEELAKAFGIAEPKPAPPKSRAGVKTPKQEQAEMDAFFGGPAESMPAASPTPQIADLDALFSEPPTPAAPAPSFQERDDPADFFGEAAVNAAEQGGDFESASSTLSDAELDSLFSQDTAEMETEVSVPEVEPQISTDLDEFFETKPSQEPTRESSKTQPVRRGGKQVVGFEEPSFVEEATKPAEEAPKRRRGRKEAVAAETGEEMIPAPERPKRVKPVKVVEEAPYDPFEKERNANRRSRRPLLGFGVVAIIALALIGVALLSQRPAVAPVDPVIVEMAGAADDLKSSGFTTVMASRSGEVVQLTICSVPGPGLQKSIYNAYEIIARRVATVRDSVQTAQIEVVLCGDEKVKLYRAAAPIKAITDFIDGGRADPLAFHASWQKN